MTARAVGLLPVTRIRVLTTRTGNAESASER